MLLATSLISADESIMFIADHVIVAFATGVGATNSSEAIKIPSESQANRWGLPLTKALTVITSPLLASKCMGRSSVMSGGLETVTNLSCRASDTPATFCDLTV